MEVAFILHLVRRFNVKLIINSKINRKYKRKLVFAMTQANNSPNSLIDANVQAVVVDNSVYTCKYVCVRLCRIHSHAIGNSLKDSSLRILLRPSRHSYQRYKL